jgi:hypothetical protein
VVSWVLDVLVEWSDVCVDGWDYVFGGCAGPAGNGAVKGGTCDVGMANGDNRNNG